MRKRTIRVILNTAALIVLGLIMQTGGAYLVNAACKLCADTGPVIKYMEYMANITQIGHRQYIHILFVAPILEELVFRLIFLRAGRMVMPFWAANLVQALLFGFYHRFMVQRIYGFVLGLIIGCVFYYCPLIYRKRYSGTDSLLDLPDSLIGVGLTIILHMTINAGGLFVSPHFPADTPMPVQFIMGTLLMAVVVSVCVVLKKQASQNSPYDRSDRMD